MTYPLGNKHVLVEILYIRGRGYIFQMGQKKTAGIPGDTDTLDIHVYSYTYYCLLHVQEAYKHQEECVIIKSGL